MKMPVIKIRRAHKNRPISYPFTTSVIAGGEPRWLRLARAFGAELAQVLYIMTVAGRVLIWSDNLKMEHGT
jgi:hypothetical protein